VLRGKIKINRGHQGVERSAEKGGGRSLFFGRLRNGKSLLESALAQEKSELVHRPRIQRERLQAITCLEQERKVPFTSLCKISDIKKEIEAYKRRIKEVHAFAEQRKESIKYPVKISSIARSHYFPIASGGRGRSSKKRGPNYHEGRGFLVKAEKSQTLFLRKGKE